MKKEYTTDQLIKVLENFAYQVDEKIEILETLQRIYGNEKGTCDFFNHFYTGNYNLNIKDIVEFLAGDCDLKFKEFVNTYLTE